jgi:hypothetical protein
MRDRHRLRFHLRLRHHTNLSHTLTRTAAPYFGLKMNKAGILRFELPAGVWRSRRPCSRRWGVIVEKRPSL